MSICWKWNSKILLCSTWNILYNNLNTMKNSFNAFKFFIDNRNNYSVFVHTLLPYTQSNI